MKGNERKMKGNERKWKEMKGNERTWKEMEGNERKRNEMKGKWKENESKMKEKWKENERKMKGKWKETKGNQRKMKGKQKGNWKEMKRNERKWKEATRPWRKRPYGSSVRSYHHHRHHQEEGRGTQRKIENLFVNFLVIFSFKILFKKQFFLCLSGPPHTKAPAAKTIAPGKTQKKKMLPEKTV